MNKKSIKTTTLKPLGMTKSNSKLLQEFIERSCEELNVRQSDVFSPSREAATSHLRSSIMYLINKRLRVTMTNIGKMFDRDHTTVVHSVQKVRDMKKSDHMYFVYNAVEPIWREVFYGTLFEDEAALALSNQVDEEVSKSLATEELTKNLNGVFTTNEVAEILRCCRATVVNMLKRGDIKYFKVGRDHRIPASEIKKIMSVQ